MKDLIAGLISKDRLLEITFVPGSGMTDTLRGHFVTSNDNALAISLDNERVRLLPISSIRYLDLLSESRATEGAATDTLKAVNADSLDSNADADATRAALADTADDDKSNVFSNTPILSAPKIVGKIELTRYDRTNRFNRPPYETSYDSYEPDANEELIPAMGKISRLGPKFGFIQPNDPEADSIYVARGEILEMHGVIKAPREGDEVIYTPSVNRQGTAAKCVHRRCSLHTLEEMASRLSAYDHRNTAILRARIKAVQDGTPLETAYTEPTDFRRQRTAAEPRQQLDPQTVIEMIDLGETVTARNITECEDQLSATLPYSEFIEALDKLLNYSMEHNLTSVHRLLSRGIRVARENEDVDTALRFAKKACDYYRDMPGNFKFFSAIEHRLLHPTPKPVYDTEGADAAAAARVAEPAAEAGNDDDDDDQADAPEADAEADAEETAIEETSDELADGESGLITI